MCRRSRERERDRARLRLALSDSQSCPWKWDLTASPFVKSIKLSAAVCFIREKAVHISHYHICLTWFCLRVCVCVRLFLRACVCGWPLPLTGIAPNITAGPSDSAVIDGMSVILHCETSGAPRPAITWQKGAWANIATFWVGPHYAAFGLVKLRRELWKGFRMCISSEQALLLYFAPLLSLLFVFSDISPKP